MKLENVIYCGDNLIWLKKFPDKFIDLIYLDPPFFSNRHYEVIFNDGEEIRSFEDRWKGGINHYVDWMKDRVFELHRVLKDTGSFYLHCDWHASHYLKVMCDNIFGYSKFRNEIVWHYRRWTGKAKIFQKLHDVILFYTKSDNYKFNVLYTEYTEGSVDRKMQGILHRFKGNESFLVSDKTIDKKGVRENDVWQIPFVAPSAKERLGYLTQKPKKLLYRIIKASSKKDDIVLDPFCGSGTTLIAAKELKRKFIGIDTNCDAIDISNKRLKEIKEKK